MKKTNKEKELIKAKTFQLKELIRGFCSKYLNNDYEQLCFSLVDRMARKRQVPYLTGRLNIWAASVIHQIGRINFLYDKSFQPYVSMGDIADYFETSKKTIGPKATQIEQMFKMRHFHPDFSTVQMMEKSLFRNLVLIDGFIVPAPDEFFENEV
ncbi:MAG: hypothetical protein CL678_04160 [Bdellovibrionaceae bacterium]|nr:hypothetical protein [Pseudobdellovibrionaceae bacterium]|tara:strand:+ start:4317 stop:4778 length:462 start_codon:yes stop_codon:yes gene_type:complete